MRITNVLLLALSMSSCASINEQNTATTYKYSSHPYDYNGESKIEVSNSGDVCTIKLTGVLSNESFNTFTLAVSNVSKRKCRDTWVILDSPGGISEAGVRIGKLVRERGYSTSLPQFGGSCSSACAYVFIAGIKREIPRSLWSNKIGFHQSSWHHGNSKQCATGDSLVNRITLMYAKQMLPEKAANKFRHLSSETDCHSIKFFSGQELVDHGIATGQSGY